MNSTEETNSRPNQCEPLVEVEVHHQDKSNKDIQCHTKIQLLKQKQQKLEKLVKAESNPSIKLWMQKNAHYLTQLINLHKTQQQKDFDLKTLQQQNSSLTEQVQTLQTKVLKTHREYMLMVQREREKNMQQMGELTAKLITQADQFTQLCSKWDAMKDVSGRLLIVENNQLKQQQKINEMELQMCACDKKNADFSTEIGNVKTESENLKTLLNFIEGDYKTQIDEIQAKWLTQTNKVTSDMSQDCKNMEAKLKRLGEEYTELRKKYKNLEKESEMYKNENKNFVRFIRTQESIIGQQKDEIHTQGVHISKLTHQLQTENLQQLELKKEIDGLKESNQLQLTQITELKSEIINNQQTVRKRPEEEIYGTNVNNRNVKVVVREQPYATQSNTQARNIYCQEPFQVPCFMSENNGFANATATNANIDAYYSNILFNNF